MCVAFLFLKARGDASRAPAVVLCVNRDEAFGRPTLPSHWWEDAPEVFAGRDLEAGGTWCGISRTGRVAVLTNYAEPAEVGTAPSAVEQTRPSRGALAADFLRGATSQGEPPANLRTPSAYAAFVKQTRDAYAGFNLIVGDCVTNEFAYVGNRGDASGDGSPVCLNEDAWTEDVLCTSVQSENYARGVALGVSNATLKTPWPKVVAGAARLADAVAAYARGSNQRPSEDGDERVPTTEDASDDASDDSLSAFAETLVRTVLQNDGTWRPVSEKERRESSALATSASAFVAPGAAPGPRAVAYGTRCSTVVAVRHDGKAAVVVERTLAWSAERGGSSAAGDGAWSAPRTTAFAIRKKSRREGE